MDVHWHRSRQRSCDEHRNIYAVWLRHHVEQSHRTVSMRNVSILCDAAAATTAVLGQLGLPSLRGR